MNPAKNDLKDVVVGRNPVMCSVIEIAEKIAPNDIPVFIEGESGSGKEWLAKAIHFASPRRVHEFVVVDCSSYAESFLESELFGYVRGSFAGAIHDKSGLLELADGGTVLLDHIEQMKSTLQGKFLRLLNQGTYHKVGGVAELKVDIRFIVSTNQNLKGFVSKGKFREDLYYQLNTVRLSIPPLRERPEDIPLLTKWFLAEIAKRDGAQVKRLSKEAEALLKTYEWPGNVRELEREIEKSVILAGSARQISASHLATSLTGSQITPLYLKSTAVAPLKEQKRKVIGLLEKNAITDALKRTAGNRTKASRLLGLSRQELIRKISTYKIPL